MIALEVLQADVTKLEVDAMSNDRNLWISLGEAA